MESIIPSLSRELKDAFLKLDSLRKKVNEAEVSISLEYDLWVVYLVLEESIATIKLYLSIENPGKFIIFKKIEDERELINTAYESMSNGIEQIESGSIEKAIESLRDARNCLRFVLKRLRKRRLREMG